MFHLFRLGTDFLLMRKLVHAAWRHLADMIVMYIVCVRNGVSSEVRHKYTSVNSVTNLICNELENLGNESFPRA